MSNRASLELTLGSPSKSRRKAPGDPFRILFLADLSGRPATDPFLKVHHVSHESIDATIRSVAPTAKIAIRTPVAIDETLTFESLDDFHPDSLMRSMDSFRALRMLGDRLGNPATRDEALEQLGELIGGHEASETPSEAVGDAAAEDTEEMMQRLLGTGAGTSRESRAKDTVASFIENVVADAPIEKPSVAAEVGQQQVDKLIAAALRAVLMSEPFRDLERAWLSVQWLTQRLDTEAVELRIVDASKSEVSEHVAAYSDRLDESALHQLLCEPAHVDQWDLIVGDYSFALDADDLVLLTTLGAIAGQAGTPFIAHGDLSLCGCNSLADLDSPWDWQVSDDELGEFWSQVRGHPAAQWIGLFTPRIVLRQPYGPESDPIDTFDFRELPSRPDAARFTWGNPAIACAYLMGRARADELDFTGIGDLEVEDLPAVLYDDGTGQALQPPVEALLGERAMNQVQLSGLVPLLGRRDSNAVRCTDLCTIATTATRLTD